jgi:hypothetical protein
MASPSESLGEFENKGSSAFADVLVLFYFAGLVIC